MALYQKHRPTSFSQVVGSDEVVEQLQTLLAKPDPPHAFLLTGPTGCGKTTLGRIVAAQLGVDPQDFLEVDSADFRGIDSIRDIRRNSHYSALRGERRAWLLDECHKLSNDAQNALLKGLEDPPAHCHFILCTTDPDKLLSTIRGRCVTYAVKLLAERDMVRLLHRVSAAEGQPLSRPLLQAIAERSGGHARDALQILEKVLAASEDQRAGVVASSEVVKDAAGKLAQELLGSRGWKSVRTTLAALSEDDVESVRRGVMGYCSRILLNGESDAAGEVMDEFREPFFNSGMPGLVLACYRIVRSSQA